MIKNIVSVRKKCQKYILKQFIFKIYLFSEKNVFVKKIIIIVYEFVKL